MSPRAAEGALPRASGKERDGTAGGKGRSRRYRRRSNDSGDGTGRRLQPREAPLSGHRGVEPRAAALARTTAPEVRRARTGRPFRAAPPRDRRRSSNPLGDRQPPRRSLRSPFPDGLDAAGVSDRLDAPAASGPSPWGGRRSPPRRSAPPTCTAAGPGPSGRAAPTGDRRSGGGQGDGDVAVVAVRGDRGAAGGVRG